MYHRTPALILKTMDFKETDALVTLFSRDLGKIKAIAKGVKKPRSSLRGLLQPFCCSSLYLVTSGDMYLVTQGKIVSFFGGIREDLQRTLNAVYLMELLDKSLADRDPNPALFDFTVKVLEAMNSGLNSTLLMRLYEIKLLTLLGYAPVLKRCSNCGSEEGLAAFSVEIGGALCEACRRGVKDLTVSGAALKALNALQERGIEMAMRLKVSRMVEGEMEKILDTCLEHHLERSLQVKRIMRDLEKGRSD